MQTSFPPQGHRPSTEAWSQLIESSGAWRRPVCRRGCGWAGPPHAAVGTNKWTRWQFLDQAPPAPNMLSLSQEPTPPKLRISLLPVPGSPRRGLGLTHPAPQELKDPCFLLGHVWFPWVGLSQKPWLGLEVQCLSPYHAMWLLSHHHVAARRCQEPFQTQGERAGVKKMHTDNQLSCPSPFLHSPATL